MTPLPARSPVLVAFATLALAALSSVFILHPFSPDFPQGGLDPSWAAVVGEAAPRHARWGLDIAFTYGPASPFATTYYNGQYLALTLPWLLAFSLVHGVAAASLLSARREGARPLLALLLYGATLLGLCVQQAPDAFFYVTILVVFLLDLDRAPGDRLARAAVVLGVAATGVFCLSKLSYGLAALPLFLVADARAALRRHPPFRLALAAAGFVGADLLYGQRLGDLPAFLAMQRDIIGGYTAAMSVPGSKHELVLFLPLAAALLGITALFEARTARPWPERLALPLGLAAFLYVAFKAGFVRHDLHSLMAWACLAAAGVLIGIVRLAPRSPATGIVVTLAALVVLFRIYPYVLLKGSGEVPDAANMVSLYGDWFGQRGAAETRGMTQALTDPQGFVAALDRGKAEAWAAIAASAPLPKLDGTVDVLQSEQSTIMANGLDYHPRPSFQDYSTYAPGLIEANRAFYEGADAPDWLIFAPGSIDDRYPAFAEGPLWPVLLRRYAPVRWIGENVALRRRAEPAPDILGTPATVTAGFDQTVPVPGEGAVLAHIAVKPTLVGRLMGLVFRPPVLTMVVRLEGGEEVASRFIPAIAEGGFVLSPRIDTARGYARLAFGMEGAGPRVTAVRIVGGRTAGLAYAADIAFTFTRLDTGGIARTPDAEAFARDLAAQASQPVPAPTSSTTPMNAR